MEPPVDFTADAVREREGEGAARHPTPIAASSRDVVRGQYGPGHVEGKKVPGYRQEPGVARLDDRDLRRRRAARSTTGAGSDTPFYVRAGKRLAKRETTIAIQFQRAPHPPFAKSVAEDMQPNVLVVHVQPDEGVSLGDRRKGAGAGLTIRTATWTSSTAAPSASSCPRRTSVLILDCLLGS